MSASFLEPLKFAGSYPSVDRSSLLEMPKGLLGRCHLGRVSSWCWGLNALHSLLSSRPLSDVLLFMFRPGLSAEESCCIEQEEPPAHALFVVVSTSFPRTRKEESIRYTAVNAFAPRPPPLGLPGRVFFSLSPCRNGSLVNLITSSKPAPASKVGFVAACAFLLRLVSCARRWQHRIHVAML